MAGGALQAALAAALLLAGCGGRCPAGVDGHGSGGAGAPSSAPLAGDDQRQLKLDAVRHQILSKLSLRERPPQHRESAPPLARELALEALRRVHLLPEPRALEDQGAPDPRQEDDYYGRTAEIIAFAEPVRTNPRVCQWGQPWLVTRGVTAHRSGGETAFDVATVGMRNPFMRRVRVIGTDKKTDRKKDGPESVGESKRA
ncbi:hypothetical protein MRX96_029174 [Rhipicephalus microplus]